jgi:hypothetical protein
MQFLSLLATFCVFSASADATNSLRNVVDASHFDSLNPKEVHTQSELTGFYVFSQFGGSSTCSAAGAVDGADGTLIPLGNCAPANPAKTGGVTGLYFKGTATSVTALNPSGQSYAGYLGFLTFFSDSACTTNVTAPQEQDFAFPAEFCGSYSGSSAIAFNPSTFSEAFTEVSSVGVTVRLAL